MDADKVRIGQKKITFQKKISLREGKGSVRYANVLTMGAALCGSALFFFVFGSDIGHKRIEGVEVKRGCIPGSSRRRIVDWHPYLHLSVGPWHAILCIILHGVSNSDWSGGAVILVSILLSDTPSHLWPIKTLLVTTRVLEDVQCHHSRSLGWCE